LALPPDRLEFANIADTIGVRPIAVRSLAAMSLGRHVGLVGEVVVRLDRGRRVHHVEGQRTARRQVAPHDPVTHLGHLWDPVDPVDRVHAEAEPDDSQRLGNPLHQGQVRVKLVAGLVDGSKRGAGELELTARLERDARAVLLEGDDVGALADARPAVDVGDPLEQGTDAASGLEGHGVVAVPVDADLLVLGADAPPLLGLFPVAQEVDHRVDRLDRRVEVGRRPRTQAHSASLAGSGP
jgi:hypothetical protein